MPSKDCASLKFDVVLEPAKSAPDAIVSPRIATCQSPTVKTSLDDIKTKLKLAEDRRAVNSFYIFI